jgi:hypothetical protein
MGGNRAELLPKLRHGHGEKGGSMAGRLSLAGSLFVIILGLAVAIAAAQRTVAPSAGQVLVGDRALQRTARAASTNDPEAVRQFTDELLRSSPLTSTAAPSLRDRVYNTE